MNGFIERPGLLETLKRRFRGNPVVLLLGVRQCGKTTMARCFVEGREAEFFDLESPVDRARLAEPMTALGPLGGKWVVIDEAQLMPEVFPVLRVLVDRPDNETRFLLLGSASPDLVTGVSESLAGRVALVPMGGFGLDETGTAFLRRLWWRGGLPRSFLAASDGESREWRQDFIQTFLERDLRRYGVQVSPTTLHRFWSMTAHYHGQIWNASEIGRSLGQAHTTIRRYLDILCGAFVMRQLPPWHENISKRQIRSPKTYVRDSGLLHELLGIASFAALEGHPKLGASWEGFALEEILKITGDRNAYFWHTQGGAEIDLFVEIDGKRFGFEFKYADAPRLTRSARTARKDLGLERVFFVYPGKQSFPLESWAEALAIDELHSRLHSLVRRPG